MAEPSTPEFISRALLPRCSKASSGKDGYRPIRLRDLRPTQHLPDKSEISVVP
ncbi:hypothetical protein CMEL01_15245 [Colletotrichum melonis]|uniref:Uncharacterized protein n=1 Tax=Colletotrichum melonis TaxID=1209925 RepID=A0AAI9XVB6_9PEZI|nr:hypothetical protein CMEL01_15245 [Colletotrichum melonis]